MPLSKLTKYLSLFSFLVFIQSCSSIQMNKDSIEIETKEITYKTGQTEMKGHLSYPVGDKKKKYPGIIVVHEWWGQNNYSRSRADLLAQQGYVTLALDMYGQGKQATHPKDAMKFSKAVFKNIEEAKARFMAALEVLKSQENVDTEQIGAIGYCFGGGIVLTMARMGVELDAVASFHGSLSSPIKAKKGEFDGDVYIFNGAADPMVSAADITNIKEEFKSADIDLKIKNYDGAQHAFTNPEATQLGKKFGLPLSYNLAADQDSWSSLLDFFAEEFDN